MLVIPIKFQFDIESEIHRVKRTLEDSNWFRKNNYRFLLPKGIDIDTFENKQKEIENLIRSEYDPSFYQTAEKAILKSWEGNNKFIQKINQKMLGTIALADIKVILTRYGTQGSYMVPNSIIINISNVPPEFLIKTVIHESVHLMIENLIKKYSIEHWVKERIVDLIVDLEYKSRFKMQSVPNWATEVDAIFKENYPDLISIMEKASKITLAA